MSKIPQNSKAAQIVEMAVFEPSNLQKLISRKIWNFHIVYSQLGCPGLEIGICFLA